ncbi:MAG: lysylphosphatidylglycerol synthase domain-containing protein [Woeseia sp.]
MTKTRIVAYSRLASFFILVAVTIFGIYRFATGDWTSVTAYWKDHLGIIPLLLGISVIDVMLEAIAWMWVYHRFRIRAFDRGGSCAFLAGRAGLLLPAQLGRLIRPDAMVKLDRARVADALKAEGVVFVLDGISVVALLAGLLAYRTHPGAAPVVAIAMVVAMVFLGNTISRFMANTYLHLPSTFWWAWPTMFITLINMGGWVANGIALHVVVADLPGNMTLWDSLFLGPGSAVLGVATGLPGGIGVTEGILGASLRIRSVPVEHLAVAVAAFRLITFWIWIPIGWLAIAILRRRLSAPGPSPTATVLPKGEGV